MEFLRKHFEKVAFAIGFLAVTSTAVLVSVHLSGARRVDPAGWITTILKAPRKAPPPPDTNALAAAVAKAETPAAWTNETGFRPPPRVLIAGKLVDPATAPSEGIEAPLCDWLKSYQLPCTIGADKADPDKDGWTNREEWKFQTNPTNAVSAPKIEQCLVFVRAFPRVFPLKFTGYVQATDGRYTFVLNERAEEEKTLFVGLNDRVRTGKDTWLVQGFKQLSKPMMDSEIQTTHGKDVSELTLSKVTDGKRIVLTYGEELPEGYSKVELLNLLDSNQLILSPGDELELKGHKLRLKEIRENGVVLTGPKGEQIRIERLRTASKQQ